MNGVVRVKPIHLNNDSFAGNTGLWLDYTGFAKHGNLEYDPINFDIVVWFQSLFSFYGGEVNPKMLTKWNWLCDYSQEHKIYYHFSDFLIPVNDPYRINSKIELLKSLSAKTLNAKNIHVLHFCQNEKRLIQWWSNQTKTLKIPDNNFHFLDLAVNYWLEQTPGRVLTENKRIVYIGNYRSGARLQFLSKFKDIDVYGKYPEKILQDQKYKYLNFHDKINQVEAIEIIKNSFAQLITYDKVGIDAQATSSRLLLTISAGCLPIIDYRLRYLVPDKFKHLFVETGFEAEDIVNEMTQEQRVQEIKELQGYYGTLESIQNFSHNLNEIIA